MDWLTFVSELVKALAWPSVVFVLLFLLRKPIADLIPLVRKLKYKDFEAQFGARLEEVEILEAEAAPALPAPPAPPAPPALQQLPPGERPPAFSRRHFTTDAMPLALQLVEKSPRAAILEAWIDVERAGKAAVQRLKLVAITPRSFLDVIRILDKADVLDAAQVAILHELRSLRNDAAHSADIALSSEIALRYLALAQSLKDKMDAVGRADG